MGSQDTNDMSLEEYKCLVSIIQQIFTEFWQGNAFFVSFFSGVIALIVINFDQVESAPVVLAVGVPLFMGGLGIVWAVSNIKHLYYTNLHIAHAAELERKLGYSIYARRLAPASRLARVSVRRAWAVVPILFIGATVGLWAVAVFCP